MLDELGKKKFEKMKNRYTLEVNLKLGIFTSSEEVRIVVIGKTGVGKSTTANTILGRHLFEEAASSASVTRKSRMRENNVNGRMIKVIDTPGLHDTHKSKEEITQEIARVMKVFADGIHAFIYVQDISNPRFTQENKETLELIEQDMFGGGINSFRLLVYSKADILATSSLDNFRDEQIGDNSQAIAHFLKDLDWRIVAVNNKTTIPAEKKRNQEVIIGMVDKLRQHNDDAVYTNEMFEEAVKKRKELEEKGKKMGWNPALMAAVEQVIAEDPGAAKDSKKLNELIQHHMQKAMEENARKAREARRKWEEEEAKERDKMRVLREKFEREMEQKRIQWQKQLEEQERIYREEQIRMGQERAQKKQEPIQPQKQQDMERQQVLEKEQEERRRQELKDKSRKEKQEREKVKQEQGALTEKKRKEKQKREEQTARPEKPERGLEKVKRVEGERQVQIARKNAAQLAGREQRQQQAEMEEARLRMKAQEERLGKEMERARLQSEKVIAENEKQLQILREALKNANTAKEASEIAREHESVFNSMVGVVKRGWTKVKNLLTEP
ncbi:GTPase IMAP family member 4 [Holothuria leucospilota]|uniref:GTPase IMAP family member 4 n=1 Tax=Holothuria leucospilota TaxID=206669 RepID=A0A9Q1CTJ4_HOLLE|nr:GTPase IMAP family member 4 [Holothuria leucospilota]